jgi:hypothetical protein
MRAGEYCDAAGLNCFSASSTEGDTITVGGSCFEPAFMVTCNWNWGGNGNDDSDFIYYGTNPAGFCANNAGHTTYKRHSMVLAQCEDTIGYSWSTGAWSCNAIPSCNGSATGNLTRTVTCMSNNGTHHADSFCTGTKPTTIGASCSVPQLSSNSMECGGR